MVTIHKQDVASWLLVGFQANLHAVQEKLRFFEHKYQQPWNLFEQQINANRDEDFSRWDDYIEWKSYVRMQEDIAKKIDEIKHGHFEIA